MKKLFYIFVLAMFVCASTAFAQPNILVNGSFEQGIDPGPSFITLPIGSTSITGWTVTHNNIDYVSGYWQPADGNRSLDMNGTAIGGIEQTFTTVSGGIYEVNFAVAGNPNTNPKLKHMRVLAASDSTEIWFDATPYWTGNMGWMTVTWHFTATSEQTNLSFVSLNNESDNCCGGIALDNVSVILSASTSSAPATWGRLKSLYR